MNKQFLLIPQHYRISVVEMEDKHQQYLTAALDLHCTWAGSERTTWYHVETLQHFMRWQWTDDMVPCQSAATFHGLAVNGQHGTTSKHCNISCAGCEQTTWYHVEACNISCAGSERTWYHVEALQHFMDWEWTDNMVPCRCAATFHSQFLCYKQCPKGHVASRALHLIARSLAGPDSKPDVATALNCV